VAVPALTAVLAALLAASWVWDELILRPAPAPIVRGTVLTFWLGTLALPSLSTARWIPHCDPVIRWSRCARGATAGRAALPALAPWDR
jgi:hypothetical protein